MYKPGIVLLVTGTRERLTRQGTLLVQRLILAENSRLVLVGDCPTGVDAIVREIDSRMAISAKRFYADWYPGGTRTLDRSAGPRRNRQMVEHAVELEANGFGYRVHVLGFPSGDSRGTVDCMNQARNAGLVVTETDVSAYVAKNGGGR